MAAMTDLLGKAHHDSGGRPVVRVTAYQRNWRLAARFPWLPTGFQPTSDASAMVQRHQLRSSLYAVVAAEIWTITARLLGIDQPHPAERHRRQPLRKGST